MDALGEIFNFFAGARKKGQTRATSKKRQAEGFKAGGARHEETRRRAAALRDKKGHLGRWPLQKPRAQARITKGRLSCAFVSPYGRGAWVVVEGFDGVLLSIKMRGG